MRLGVITVLAITLAAPFAAATWGARGQYEPDTSLDVSGGYMWTTPDTTPGTAIGHKVYFNAFTIQNTAYSTHGVSDNENFATVQMEHPAWPGNVAALLGVWTDCNKDGYVGLGDNALFEYRSTLLLDTSVCPAQSETVPAGAASHQHITVHNDGTWVDEFIPLGPDNAASTSPDANPYDLNDNDARVWADWGRPTDPGAAFKCYIGFVPEGTFETTGGMLRTIDCFNSYSATAVFDGVADGNAALRPYTFSDAPTNQSNSHSQLNRANPWGQPGDAPIVNSWDCTKAPVVPHTTAAGQPVQVSAPRVPPTVNAGGSLAGTLEYESDGTMDCVASDDAPASQGGVGNGQNSYVLADVPYSQEKANLWDVSDSKKESDFPMAYNEGQRPAPTGGQLGKRDSLDQGARVESSDGQWISDARLAEDQNPYVARTDLTQPTKLPIQGVEWITAYAYVSPTAVSTYGLQLNPTGKSGIYGQESCGSATFGVHNGWDCNANDWFCGGAYSCVMPVGDAPGHSVDDSVHVGHAYQLRDVDCYDSSVGPARQAGVGYGILTGTKCS